jgi:hypothetical protein
MALLTLAALLAGCTRGSTPATPADTAPDAEWSLTVINRHSLDVSLFVITDGQRARVGSVPASATETFVLPPRMIGSSRSVQLEATAIGSPRRARSEALVIRGGQHVEWTLQNGLEHASIAIW